MKGGAPDARAMNRQSPLADTGRITVALAALVVVLAFAAAIAQERSFVTLGLQVLAVEFVGGKFAIPWTSAYRPIAGLRDLVEYMLHGIRHASVPALAAGLVAKLLGAPIEVDRIFGWGAAVGVVEIALAAARDEIMLRGMLRRGFAGLMSRPAYGALASFAAAAWTFGLGETHGTVLLREGALALVAVELWRLDDGAFSAIGFQLGFRFLEAAYGGSDARAPVLIVETGALLAVAVWLARRDEPADIVEARVSAAGPRSPLLH